MNHGEKMARIALKRWLDFYALEIKCDQCITPKEARCPKHKKNIEKLVSDTRLLLAGGPN